MISIEKSSKYGLHVHDEEQNTFYINDYEHLPFFLYDIHFDEKDDELYLIFSLDFLGADVEPETFTFIKKEVGDIIIKILEEWAEQNAD